MKGQFFPIFCGENRKFRKIDISQIEIPKYITLYYGDWYKDFELNIKKFLLSKKVQPVLSTVRLNNKVYLVGGYHRLKAAQNIDSKERKLLKPIKQKDLKAQELEWLDFSINYAVSKPYREYKEQLISIWKEIKHKRYESLEHKKEKFKVILWLLDSGIPLKFILLETRIGNLVPDLLIELPLISIYRLTNNDSNFWEERIPAFSLKLAVEIGKWHKKPNYLEFGIPFVWIPFKGISDGELSNFLKEIGKYSYYSFLIKHYVHVIDETLSGFLFIPKSKNIKEGSDVCSS